MDIQDAFNTNRDSWNKKVAVHLASDFYDLDSFKKGKSSLNIFELNALGDVNNKSLLHLQCHFGQDTLSWSRLGAKCVGVDISEEAIGQAIELNKELNLDAQFVCCNVLDVSEYIKDQFDVIYTSYGTIGWLPDLRPWAQMISERLKPEGSFYIADFHPIAWMFDYTADPPSMKYGYQQKEVIYEEYEGTYADGNSKVISKEYGWNHGLSELVNSLIEAGLTINYLKEHESSPYGIFPGLVKNNKGLFEIPNGKYPLLFELMATKINA